MTLTDRINQHNKIVNFVSSTYGIYRSSDIPSSVTDYCVDHLIKLDLEEFRRICRRVGCKVNIMQPTITDAKHWHKLLLDGLEINKKEIYERPKQ